MTEISFSTIEENIHNLFSMTKKGEFCHALKRESNFQPEKEGKKLAS